jgi:hypothetical protein
MDSSAAATPCTAAKSSPAATQPSPFIAVAAKSSPAAAAQPASPIPIVVDDDVSPSPTTSGGASHTPFFFITPWMLKIMNMRLGMVIEVV